MFVSIAFPAEADLDIISRFASMLEEDTSGNSKHMGRESFDFLIRDIGIDVPGNLFQVFARDVASNINHFVSLNVEAKWGIGRMAVMSQ